MALILALLLAAAPAGDPVKVFGDWAVACDNGWRCQAVSLLPRAEDGIADAGMIVTREAGRDGAVTVRLQHLSNGQGVGAAQIVIDGVLAARGTMDADEGLSLEGEAALRILTAMAKGGAMEVTAGRTRMAISLKGASASWRYMDEVQRRATTVTALVAKGVRRADAVPSPPKLPVVTAVRSGRADPVLPIAVEKKLRADADCENADGYPFIETHALDAQAALVLVTCPAGAFTMPSTAFVLRGGRLSDAVFTGPEWIATRGPDTPDAEWEAASATFSTSLRGRGAGDCSYSERYAWDGRRFVLVEASMLMECRGALDVPTVWRTRIVYKP